MYFKSLRIHFINITHLAWLSSAFLAINGLHSFQNVCFPWSCGGHLQLDLHTTSLHSNVSKMKRLKAIGYTLCVIYIIEQNHTLQTRGWGCEKRNITPGSNPWSVSQNLTNWTTALSHHVQTPIRPYHMGWILFGHAISHVVDFWPKMLRVLKC
jgi:hypothetical protein